MATCKETFVSPIGAPTKESAERILNDIRAAHPGWIETSGYVEERNGEWFAIRVHEKP